MIPRLLLSDAERSLEAALAELKTEPELHRVLAAWVLGRSIPTEVTRDTPRPPLRDYAAVALAAALQESGRADRTLLDEGLTWLSAATLERAGHLAPVCTDTVAQVLLALAVRRRPPLRAWFQRAMESGRQAGAPTWLAGAGALIIGIDDVRVVPDVRIALVGKGLCTATPDDVDAVLQRLLSGGQQVSSLRAAFALAALRWIRHEARDSVGRDTDKGMTGMTGNHRLPPNLKVPQTVTDNNEDPLPFLGRQGGPAVSVQAESVPAEPEVLPAEAHPVGSYDAKEQAWYPGVRPPIEGISRSDAEQLADRVEVVLVVATPVERDATLHLLRPLDRDTISEVHVGPDTYYLGTFGRFPTVVVQCEMGSIRSGSATFTVTDAVRFWTPRAAIMLGIAFGRSPDKHAIGDVLVAEQLALYEPQRIGSQVIDRGPRPSSSATLRNRFRSADMTWQFRRPDGYVCRILVGEVLTGEKLVDDATFRAELFRRYPNAVGGEMEGAGLSAAMGRIESTHWILAKAICDWGVGKSEEHQALAAAAAASLVHHVLSKETALDGLAIPVRATATSGKPSTPVVEAPDVEDAASELARAKASLLRMAEVAVLGFVEGSEEQEVTLELQTDLERRAAEALAHDGRAAVEGNLCRITVWRTV